MYELPLHRPEPRAPRIPVLSRAANRSRLSGPRARDYVVREQLEIPTQEARGVLVGAFQSEREEETRDRAERGSVVRGSDQASAGARVSGQGPKRTPLADPRDGLSENAHHDASALTVQVQTTYQQRA
jgi:hypothetical protein